MGIPSLFLDSTADIDFRGFEATLRKDMQLYGSVEIDNIPVLSSEGTHTQYLSDLAIDGNFMTEDAFWAYLVVTF